MHTSLATHNPGLEQVKAFKQEFLENLTLIQGTNLEFGSPKDSALALAFTVRQAMVEDYLLARRRHARHGAKVVAYLSAEYLMGKQLGNALLATGLTETARRAMNELGIDLGTLEAIEVEPGLGNGGLGRLAACYMDSLATLEYAAVGYGIRYEYGIFRQSFENGWQVEQPDRWLSQGDPWTFERPERAVEVGFGGSTRWTRDEAGVERVQWTPAWKVLGVPYNLLVPGFGTSARDGSVNTVRLWSARATDDFNLGEFNKGDYEEAVWAQTHAENISKVLYPDDSTERGRELRLQQQAFFTACSLADLLRERIGDGDLAYLPERVVVQLNDTHPTLAIPELMRVLMDERRMPWNDAWYVTRRVFAYTCHTLLPEALETWPVGLFGHLLPRHLEIIQEIDRRFQQEVLEHFPGDQDRARRMALVGDGRVRMAHLAVVGSFSVNGVAELHSKLLSESVLKDFSDLWPEKFTNVTNGVTPRRFLRLSNPALSELITQTVGQGWLTDLEKLRGLERHVDDAEFRAQWREIKRQNKARLARELETIGLGFDPDAMLDVMVKRLHEYKRQLLKVLHVIALYRRVKTAPDAAFTPRVVLFGAKAAPGYAQAKRIIRLMNGVAETLLRDSLTRDRLQIVFPPNYNVTLAERIYPAADVSEQISLAGKEASGTGNMKLALSGAVTIGTLDGANIEIRDRVGAENFFLFGLTEPEVMARKPNYDPQKVLEADEELRAILGLIADGTFSDGDTNLYQPILEELTTRDAYMVLEDFRSYVTVQDELEHVYADQDRWTRMSILNVARSGFFSSDRAIREYAERIWHVSPMEVSEKNTVLDGVPGERKNGVPDGGPSHHHENGLAAAPHETTNGLEPVAAPASKPSRARGQKSNPLSDDLTRIEGIGPKIAAALVASGIHSFTALENTSLETLEEALKTAKLNFAPSRATWSAQAAFLSREDQAGFETYTQELTVGRERRT
jgi:glycogen phosphorylase